MRVKIVQGNAVLEIHKGDNAEKALRLAEKEKASKRDSTWCPMLAVLPMGKEVPVYVSPHAFGQRLLDDLVAQDGRAYHHCLSARGLRLAF